MRAARPVPASVEALVADPSFAALKALIVERTGHHYYEDKDDQLGERIAQRMAASGIGEPADYLERLGDTMLGDREWRQLESELTIKETFFFRFAEQFAALRSTILPGLVAARADARRLRIWSAGCSTGAEPYSVAVVVSDLLGPALASWQVSILGTDIDEKALAAAREASYGGWSLRTMAPDERDRLFAQRDGRWRLRPAYAGMVRFERLNILDLDGAAVPLQLSDYDLILCRNMLIYFHPGQATRLVEAIGASLAPDGWLVLGHAEAGLAMGTSLRGVETGGVVAYRRAAAGEVGRTAVAPEPLPAPPSGPAGTGRRSDRAIVQRAPVRAAETAQAAGPAAELPSISTDVGDLDAVRRLLDAGDIAAAAAAIASLRGRDGDSAPLSYLDAVCALGRGDRAAAERSLRGALYLDDGFAMAYYLLAQTLMDAGRAAAARRALANALQALAAASADAPIAEGDDRSAAELRDAIRSRLDAIDAA